MEMENEEDRCSKSPFIWAIVPIALAVVLIVLVGLIIPEAFRGSCFGFLGAFAVFQFVGFPTVLAMGPMGVISVVSGMHALKKGARKGRKLVVIGIVLGILEIAAVTVILGLFLRERMN
ncbi:MAG: hypothetical protein ISS79_09185 [Phycisphaerae bacterium]|nr:hypothetical protein [Phycisphaerae bacterium]